MTFHAYVLARGFGMSRDHRDHRTGIERLTNFPRRLFVTWGGRPETLTSGRRDFPATPGPMGPVRSSWTSWTRPASPDLVDEETR